MDKPWDEMQKGSESKEVVPLKKVSTLSDCSLVVCFALHTINSPSHPPDTLLFIAEEEEGEEEKEPFEGKSNVFVGRLLAR